MKKKENEPLYYKPQYCRNCGLNGHVYKNCPHPIMSFGLICYKYENNEIKYLMLQRKDSLSFMEFMRGKYELDNINYIKQLLSNMTISERDILISQSFDDIWNYIWCQPKNNPIKNTKEYIDSRNKYNNLISINFLQNYIKTISGLFNEQEWGFPKGRRKIREYDMDCAIREFYEETRIKKEALEIKTYIQPFEEIFFGTNNVLYKHSYYVAKLLDFANSNISVDMKCLEQVREVRLLKWFNYDEVLSHIKKYNIERIEIFKQANLKIKEIENVL